MEWGNFWIQKKIKETYIFKVEKIDDIKGQVSTQDFKNN